MIHEQKTTCAPRDLGPASVSAVPGVPRFHVWQGRSRRRYVASVYELDRVHLSAEAVVLLVAIGPDARREVRGALSIGRLDGSAARRLRTATAAAGATEVHVHLLARSEAERAAALRDLGPAARAF